MTKEEAKNSLVNTKVYVAGKSAEIQKKLFELGFAWCDGSAEVYYECDPFLYIYNNTLSCGSNMKNFLNQDNREVTADHILGLTWEEKPKFQPFDKVLVRDDYSQNWMPQFYCDACDDKGRKKWLQVIPYEGNGHLAYTINNPE